MLESLAWIKFTLLAMNAVHHEPYNKIVSLLTWTPGHFFIAAARGHAAQKVNQQASTTMCLQGWLWRMMVCNLRH
jgi:hypothetical protein